MRGDEPILRDSKETNEIVYPTCVGMGHGGSCFSEVGKVLKIGFEAVWLEL